MIKPEIPANESRRLAALQSYRILDTHAEAAFDALARSAALVCDAPIAMISLVDQDRQWFKSVVGLDVAETARDVSFCGHAINVEGIFEVSDARSDDRFFDNPSVIGAPNVRFYAGAPLMTADAQALGALCVIDRRPRRMTARQRAILAELSQVVMHLLEARKAEREAADRLSKANRFLEMAEGIAHFGHFHIDGLARDLVWSNECYRILGLTRGVDAPDFDAALRLFHPDDRNAIRGLGATAIATGERYAGEYRIVRPDGALRHVRIWVEPRRLIDGENIRTFGVLHDVTEAKKAEAEAQRDRDRYNVIFDTVGDGILKIDPATGEVLNANQASCRMFGHDKGEIVGRNFGNLFSGIPPYTLDAAIERHKGERLGATQVFEWQFKRSDGALFWGEVSTRYARIGDTLAVLSIIRDISERKTVERELTRLKESAEQSSRAKTDFLSTMSHEIRTPMNGVLGMNALLLETSLTPRQRRMAETVRHSAEALLNIVDEILDVAKLEAGRVTLEPSDFDLAELIRKIHELLAVRAEPKGIGLTVEIADGARGAFRGEPARLRQILLNLVSNAIKFTERGGVSITVAAADEPDDDLVRLRFEVSDTGIGISDEAKQRLFTPFEQADPSIARRFGGTGLGLNISRKLVDLMDGEIGIADRSGGGSVFWFEVALPRAAPVGSEKDHGEEAGQTPRMVKAGGHILLAEDNRVNIEVATLVLEGAGHAVDVAVDGVEAVAAARRRVYDLILMDMRMPRMDGPSAAREIRASEGRGRRVPIVAMTANAMAGDRRLCLEAGMDDYVSKPIAPEKLRETVARWIEEAGADLSATEAFIALPVIDRDAFDELRSCMTEAKFAALMELYIAQAEADALQYSRWRAIFTLEEIGDEAHKIISSAGTFGARRLQDVAGRLEGACRQGNPASTPRLIEELGRETAAASSTMRGILAA